MWTVCVLCVCTVCVCVACIRVALQKKVKRFFLYLNSQNSRVERLQTDSLSLNVAPPPPPHGVCDTSMDCCTV